MGVLAVLGLIVVYLYLSKRISNLEEQISILHGGQPAKDAQQATLQSQTFEPHSNPNIDFVQAGEIVENAHIHDQQMQAHTPYVPREPNQFVLWLKEDFLVKLGAFLLLIAFGWFVSYAFMNNWIGPVGRISLGLLVGVVFMLLGIWRIKTREQQGAIFTVLGSTTVLLTIFAAREIYEFFTPASALFVMFASVVFVAFVAVMYRRNSLAIASLLLGAIAPSLTNADPNIIGLFSYLLVLVLGSVWVVSRIGTVALPIISFIVVFLYGVPYMGISSAHPDAPMALLFAFIFTVIFFVSNIVSILKRTDRDARQAHIVMALGTGLYIAGWIAAAVDPVWQSLMDVMWALAFAFGAFVVYMRTNDRAPFYVYGAVSIALIGIATAAELDGATLTIAYTLEVTTLLVAAKMFKDQTLLNRLSILYGVPILFSLQHILASSWRDGFMHLDFFALAILMFCLWVAATIVYLFRPADKSEGSDATAVLAVIGGIYATVLVWLVSHSIVVDDTATTISLFIYTVSGIALHLIGKNIGKNTVVMCGNVLIGLVVLRLMFVEVWTMNIAGKIITFFGIGILLIATAFISKSGRNKDEDNN